MAQVALRGLLAREGIAGRGIDLTLSERAVAGAGDSAATRTPTARGPCGGILEDVVVAPVARLLSAAGVDGDGSVVRVVLEGDEDFDAAGPVEGVPLSRTTSERPCGRPVPRCRASATIERARAASNRGAAAPDGGRGPSPRDRRRDARPPHVPRGGGSPAAASEGAPWPGQLVAEHARISQLLTALDDAVEALEGVEDLASAAVYEGEDPVALRRRSRGRDGHLRGGVRARRDGAVRRRCCGADGQGAHRSGAA